MLCANLETKSQNSNSVIFKLFFIFGGLAPNSNKTVGQRTGRGKRMIPIVHGVWCTRSNVYLSLVCASLTSTEN